MKFNQFRNNPSVPLHSSSYAKAANGDAMGVVSSQSFQERQHIEKNRRIIGRYGVSAIAQPLGDHLQNSLRRRLDSPQVQDDAPEHPRTTYGRYTTPRSTGDARGTVISSGKPGASKLQVPARKPSFVEPPTRGYNPYK